MSKSQLDRAANAQSEDGRWRSLYRIGAVSAVISIVVIPFSIVAFFILPLYRNCRCSRRSLLFCCYRSGTGLKGIGPWRPRK